MAGRRNNETTDKTRVQDQLHTPLFLPTTTPIAKGPTEYYDPPWPAYNPVSSRSSLRSSTLRTLGER